MIPAKTAKRQSDTVRAQQREKNIIQVLKEISSQIRRAASNGSYHVNKPFGHGFSRGDDIMLERIKQELRLEGYTVKSDIQNLHIRWEKS